MPPTAGFVKKLEDKNSQAMRPCAEVEVPSSYAMVTGPLGVDTVTTSDGVTSAEGKPSPNRWGVGVEEAGSMTWDYADFWAANCDRQVERPSPGVTPPAGIDGPAFSAHLAESPLLQWFCRTERLDGLVRVPSKSGLQRIEAEVPTEVLQRVYRGLIVRAATPEADGQPSLGLAEQVDLSVAWVDTTCAKLDIHYPTDWVLLRDATRNVIAAIETIRRHGLIHRMPEPSSFVRTMNQHAMVMATSSRNGRGGDKARDRKKILRAMKTVVGTVRKHGQRYRDLLATSWPDTNLSRAQADQILERLDRLLAAIPVAVKQAHERIIGGRQVPNEDKLHSLYQQHAQGYVRGKAGADVEFGLKMLLVESAEGLIVDCEILDIIDDTKLLLPAVKRIQQHYGDQACQTVITDRGFTSAANSAALTTVGVINGTLPRTLDEQSKRLKDPILRKLHIRRAQTEAPIGNFKTNFLGDTCRPRDVLHRSVMSPGRPWRTISGSWRG